MKKEFILLGLVLVMSQFTNAQKVISLYAGKAPGSENWTWTEKESRLNGYNTRLIYNVSDPTITAYLPDPKTASGTAIIIAPGGAFHILSIDSEGIEVARWLNAKGIAAFVLKYRVVKSETDDPVAELRAKMSDFKKLDEINAPVVPLAMQDGLTAVKYVRDHARDYNVLPDRIGFMGFSAGGTVTMSVIYNADETNRPNFVAPVYAYSGAIIGSAIPTVQVPIFITAASNDGLGLASHSVDIYMKWLKANQPAELHMYEKGDHGFGMKKNNIPTDAWIERFGDWLNLHGLMSTPSAVNKK